MTVTAEFQRFFVFLQTSGQLLEDASTIWHAHWRVASMDRMKACIFEVGGIECGPYLPCSRWDPLGREHGCVCMSAATPSSITLSLALCLPSNIGDTVCPCLSHFCPVGHFETCSGHVQVCPKGRGLALPYLIRLLHQLTRARDNYLISRRPVLFCGVADNPLHGADAAAYFPSDGDHALTLAA